MTVPFIVLDGNCTCEVEGVGHSGHPHTTHGPGQQACSQAPGAGPWDQQLSGVQIVRIVLSSSDQQHLSCIIP